MPPLRILLHAKVFRPHLGGIETAAANLARGLQELGESVTVLTDVLDTDPADAQCGYAVVRTRDRAARSRLIQQQDVVHAMAAFADCFIPARESGVPFSWTHQGYRLLCLDGLGWDDGAPAPMQPFASFTYHCRKNGVWNATRGLSKLFAHRLIARAVDANVAITNHVAQRQPLPRQRVIYNPVDSNAFAVGGVEAALRNLEASDCTFAFVGRLVTEKGVDDLLHAFARVISSEPRLSAATLKIIGDGPQRASLERLSEELNIGSRVRFVGALTGNQLTAEVHRSGIFVLPSAWEEPMGIVTVELMAAGKPLIVAACGGLSECAADGCLTFDNGDRLQLSERMKALALSPDLAIALIGRGLLRSQLFSVPNIAREYANLFEELTDR